MPTKEALAGKHVAYYFSSQAVEDQLEKAAQGQKTVRPTPIVKEVRKRFARHVNLNLVVFAVVRLSSGVGMFFGVFSSICGALRG